MKRLKIHIGFMLAILLMPVGVRAEDSTYELDKIIVTGKNTPVAEVNKQEVPIKETQKPVISTIPDILDETAGLDIQRRGILTPKNSQVRIRGLDEQRTLIMINGRPLNGTGVMGGFFVDWSALSTGNFEAIEISKGGFSAKYGNTLGGTINMRPTPPEEPFHAEIYTGYKRYNTFSFSGTASGQSGPFGSVFSAGYHRTDGHLRNSEAERYDINGRLYHDWGDDGQLQFSIRHTQGDYAMPVENRRKNADYDNEFPEHAGTYLTGPGIPFPSGDRHGDGSYFNKIRTEIDLMAIKQLGSVGSTITLYLNNEDRTDVIYSADLGEKILERDATPDRSWGWVSKFCLPVSQHVIGFGADGNYLGFGGADNTFIRQDYFTKLPSEGTDEWHATQWHGAYVDDEWAVTDFLDIYIGLRFDDYYGNREVDVVTGYTNGKPAGFDRQTVNFNESVLMPKAGIMVRPVPGLNLYARAARATRYPDNPAFYWYYAGYRPEVDDRTDVVRNELTYEDAMEYEIGSQWQALPDVMIKLSAYQYQVDDYIRWIFGYAPSRVIYNIDRVVFKGIELDIDGKIINGIHGFANFTWQNTKKTGDVLDASNHLTDSLSELPKKKFNCGISYKQTDGMMARLSFKWVDEREVPFLDDSITNPLTGDASPDGTSVFSQTPTELKKLDDFITVNCLVRYPVWNNGFDGFLTLGVENIFDTNYEEEYDFPAPGRCFSIGAEVAF